MVSAPSLRDLLSSYSADRSMSVTEPRPSQRAHIPPVMLKLRRSLTVRPPRSMETAPAPLIEATLNEYACGEPMCGCPRRLKTLQPTRAAAPRLAAGVVVQCRLDQRSGCSLHRARRTDRQGAS